MTEITVGTWNALNAFGDATLSRKRMQGALEVVKHMDADVLVMPETAVHGVHGKRVEGERLEEIADLMHTQGYRGYTTDYSPYADERNAHYLSMWTRVGGMPDATETEVVRVYGRRNGLRIVIPDMDISVHGIHLDDRYPAERVRSAKDLLAREPQNCEMIVLGDFNDMYSDDPKGRILRAMGRVLNRIEVGEYYDPSRRVRRIAGKAIRGCRMAGGDSLKMFAAHGFHDADPNRQPTIGRGRMAFQIDHILGSSGLSLRDFIVYSRSATPNSAPLSDHSPITARATRT